MKLKIVLSALAVTAVSVLAQPKLSIDNTTFDWGTTSEGTEKIKHTFVVVNKGNEALKITNIRTSCGCTVAKYDTTVAPGKTGNIAVEFDKSGRTGNQERTLTVYTNDTTSEQVRLTIKGLIKTALDIDQKWQSLYSDNGKVKGSVSFITENKDFAVTKAQYVLNSDRDKKLVPSNVGLTLKNKSTPDKDGLIKYEYEFNFLRAVEKYENASITFETNVKEKPTVAMNVSLEPSKNAPY